MKMTFEIYLSIAAIAISIVVPVVIMFWSLRLNTRLQERITRETDILREQVEKSVLRPEPIIDVLIDTSASLHIHPRNRGNAVAHDYTIDVRYPSESKIKSIETEYFDIKDGGIDMDFVKLYKEKFPPWIIMHPIRIDAERAGKTVLPIEVSVVCLEQKAMMTLPPLRE